MEYLVDNKRLLLSLNKLIIIASDLLLIRGNIGAQVVGRIKVKLSYIDY